MREKNKAFRKSEAAGYFGYWSFEGLKKRILRNFDLVREITSKPNNFLIAEKHRKTLTHAEFSILVKHFGVGSSENKEKKPKETEDRFG